ncbi:MAG TPA: hypothetical protein VGA32_01370 [Anaerolineales bacterium]
MTLILLLLAGSLAAAILQRRGGRAAWLVAVAFAALGWFISLLQSRGLPRTWPLGEWGFLAGSAARLELTLGDVEWRLGAFVATLVLMLLLSEPSRGVGLSSASRMGFFLYAAAGVFVLSAGTALTMALSLPVLDLLTRWLPGRGSTASVRWIDDRWGLRFDATAIVWLAVAVAAGESRGWPSSSVILGIFALRIAGAFSSWRTRPVPAGSPEAALVLILPIAVAIKLMAEAIRANGMEPLPAWTLVLAALLGGYALLRSSAQPVRLCGGPFVIAMGALALAAGGQGGVASMDTLGWLGAVALLSAGAVFVLEIHGLEDRVWGASALSLLFLLPLVGAQAVSGLDMSADGAVILLVTMTVAAAALWAVFARRLGEPPREGGGPDMPSRMIARLGFALPAVAGIGLGVRSASAASPIGLAVSGVALAIGFGISRLARGRESSRRSRWERAVEWIDLPGAASAILRLTGLAGRAIRGLAGLFEGGSGILWAWALLLALILLGGGQA